ncbi:MULTISPECIES: hypothetical protein [Okeania]|nr:MULTISPECIES: hypothetical protein [Okeania]
MNEIRIFSDSLLSEKISRASQTYPTISTTKVYNLGIFIAEKSVD